MKEETMLQYLTKNNYVDDRKLFCLSKAKIFSHPYSKQLYLPSKMILSLQSNKLFVFSKKHLHKSYYTCLYLEKLSFVKFIKKNNNYIYEFLIDLGLYKNIKFFIQGSKNKKEIEKLANAIKE